jgi:protein-S-isoprenylcysteine O-methyltransferase Ste14
MFKPASPWEYRWKFCILLLSQPLFAWVGFYALGLNGNWYAPEFSSATAVTAVCIGFLGCLLRVCGVTTLTASIMGSKNPDTNALVTHGIFAAVRNPLYLGTTLIFAAYGLFFSWTLAGVFMLFHWLRYERIIRYEEKLLSGNWSEQFVTYCQNVRRWWPRFSGSEKLGPVFSVQGLKANGMFVGIWLGMLASALTGNLALLVPFQVAGGTIMILHFVQSGRTNGSARPLETANITASEDNETRRVA